MIVENQYLKELTQIYKENNQGYIDEKSNQMVMETNMLKVVYVEDDIPIGFIAVYEGKDFITKEEFPLNIEKIANNTIYIWQIITRKGYEGKGIARSLLTYVINKYQGYEIYSCVEPRNIASLRLHLKQDFLPIQYFEKLNGQSKIPYLALKR